MINPLKKPISQHFDDDWKFHVEQGPSALQAVQAGPELDPIQQQPEPEIIRTPGAELTEAEVVRICRAHFATFENLEAAAAHYGLTDGRLSQIQSGIYVGCPRVQLPLGIKRERGTGVYRWIDESEAVPVPPKKPAPTTGSKETLEFIANWIGSFDLIRRAPKPSCARPEAGDLKLRKQILGVISVGLNTRRHLLTVGEQDAEYLKNLEFIRGEV